MLLILPMRDDGRDNLAFLYNPSPNGGAFCLAFNGFLVRVGFRVRVGLRVRVGFRVRARASVRASMAYQQN